LVIRALLCSGAASVMVPETWNAREQLEAASDAKASGSSAAARRRREGPRAIA